MQTKFSLLSAVVALCVAGSTYGSVISITDNPLVVSGLVGTDYNIYKQVGSTLVNDNTVTPASVLSGPKTQTAPGGNIHLHANGDGDTLAAFQTDPHISLIGSLGGHAIVVSSLTGTDWFTTPSNTYSTAYGQPTLANKWFSDFLTTYNFTGLLTEAGYNASTIASQEAGLFSSFTNAQAQLGIPGGFQRLSTTSVSYVHEDTATSLLTIGIADTDGYLFPLIKSYVQQAAPKVLNDPDFPTDVYAGKTVLLSIDGQTPTPLYSFSSVPSGLSTTDGTNSYNLEFQVGASVPEPASCGLLLTTAGVALLRRRRGQS